ncbi:putative UvrD/REP helicase [Shigella boydii 4444-74]|uniref:Putative UvrD/REP helicase n=1 Tax=Shigella boydii 4444-74 TaxID=766140 RepID=I6F7R1_SHIBO|nr:putative UvrD/REP helicase [Shigella boydii 4444-74]
MKKHLNAINQVASLKAEINELNIEYKYLQQWQSQNLRPEELFLTNTDFPHKKQPT